MPSCNSVASHKRGGKKESTDLRLSQACRPYATPSSISFFDCHLSDAHTAEDEAVKSRSQSICQSSANAGDENLSHLEPCRRRVALHPAPSWPRHGLALQWDGALGSNFAPSTSTALAAASWRRF